MVVFPNTKINLGLQVIGKRNDGFHEMSSLFLPVSLTDVLEIIESPLNHEKCMLEISGIAILGDVSENLCYKAYQLLDQEFNLPPVKIYLHKVIPMGAGLGGGSSDGAFCLSVLNKLFSLGITNKKLMEKAAILGSDCPFFIQNQPALISGRGETVQPIDFSKLNQYIIALVYPGIHISTAEAFSNVACNSQITDLMDCLQLDMYSWKNVLLNDFEHHVFQMHPEILEVKEKLYEMGAIYSSMTGTGSTVYGVFNKSVELKQIFPQYFTWQGLI